MKHVLSSFIGAAAVFAVATSATLPLCAEEVTGEEAMSAVAGWVNVKEALGAEFTAQPADVLECHGLGGTGTYYVVSLEGGGFVVTSGDTAMEPVLAYSKEGAWNTNAAENPLMAMLEIDVAAVTGASGRRALPALRLMASDTQSSDGDTVGRGVLDAPQSANVAKWARYKAAASTKGGLRLRGSSPSDLRVNYLVQTYWGQSGHGENYYTPGSYVCGCVATMGSQIMRFWKWPQTSSAIPASAGWYSSCGSGSWNVSEGYCLTSSGSKTRWDPAFGGPYDWDNMPNAGGSNTTQKKAIGRLTRDVGISCFMNYQSGSSGAPGAVFGHRLVDQFMYANAKVINGWNDASRDALLASLDAGLPCGMNVSGSGGHAIVADGYGYSSDTLYIHFNMGWSSTGATSTWYTPPNIGDFTSVDNIIYNIYPPSKGDPELTVVSGRVLDGSSVKSSVTVTATERTSGKTFSVTSNSKGIYALMLPAGFYTISATSGSKSCKIAREVKQCVSCVYGGGQGLYLGGSANNVHNLDLSLTTTASAVTPTLTHRWSFTSDLSDSVGSATATKNGSSVAVSGGMVKMTGNGHNAGSLNLGTNLLNTDAATIEIWARQNAARNWARVFDYGADDTHYFTLTWSQGTDVTTDRAASKNTNEILMDHTMGPYEFGTMYHISVTFEKNPDGSTFVRWMRRDAVTGALQKTGSLTMTTGIQNITDPKLYLGYSQYSGDRDAYADYDEVRVWSGVLSDSVLSAHAKLGPDTISDSAPSFVAKATWSGSSAPASAADLNNSGNWTCYDQNGNSLSGVPGEKTTVVIPTGNTTFTVPPGYTPNWHKVQLGTGGTATLWAKIDYDPNDEGTTRSALSGYAWKDLALNTYEAKGAGDVSYLQNKIAPNPTLYRNDLPVEIERSQLRYDGWVYVPSSQAGRWRISQYMDDYFTLIFDDEWLIHNNSYSYSKYAVREVAPGWHSFTIICGDTYGSYGPKFLSSEHKLAAMCVSINEGAQLAFNSSNFQFGSGTQTVKLNADCDLSTLGEIAVDTGSTIDLNGHRLKVSTIKGDGLSAAVTSSASGAKLICSSGVSTVNTDNLTIGSNVTLTDGSGDVVATPVISPSNAPDETTFFSGSKTVTITCATADATIYYTLDGSEPTTSSTKYTGAITVSDTKTVKARAFKTTYNESAITTVYYTRLTEDGELIINGDFEQSWLTDSGNRWAYASDIGTRATVPHWTHSGSSGLTLPNTTWCANISEFGSYVTFLQQTSSNGGYFEQKIKVPTAGTYRIAFDYAARPNYVGATAQLQFAEGSGAFTTLASIAPSATTRSSYLGTVTVSSAGVHTLRITQSSASADKANIFDNFSFKRSENVATPTSPTATTFFANSHSVTLQCATAGATIRYTTNGSEPTSSSTAYTGPITITATTTIKAKAFKDGFRESDTYTQTFTLTGTVETPTCSPAAMTFFDIPLSITLSCGTSGATIRYTTNGSEPTASSTQYAGAISLNDTTTIKAKAFVTFTGGTFESDVMTATFTLAPQATASGTYTSNYRSGSVSLTSEIDGATIYYTTDGTTPTTSSAVYDGSFVFDGNNRTGTITAIAYADGYRPSEVFTIDYYLKQFFGPTTGENPAAYEDTPQNRADYWIFENEDYKEATGLWSNAVEYVDHKVAIDEGNEFMADNPSAGRNVIIETKATFNSAAEEHQDYDGVKAAVRIGTNACFQVYTTNANGRVWLDTEGFTAEVNHDYTVKIELDVTNKMYTVDVKDGANYVPLTADGNANFPFAFAGDSLTVQSIGYVGEGAVESIFGSYTNKVFGFCVNDVVRGSDADNAPLTAAQADWLNAFPSGHDAVASRIRTLTVRQFSDAYLLNLDLMQNFGYGFNISDISTANENVTVDVTLVRTNALATAGINGTLKLYGGETLDGITNVLDKAEFDNAKFSRGDTAQAEFQQDGTNIFYKAIIE